MFATRSHFKRKALERFSPGILEGERKCSKKIVPWENITESITENITETIDRPLEEEIRSAQRQILDKYLRPETGSDGKHGKELEQT